MESRITHRNRRLKALNNIGESAAVEPLSGDRKRERARRQSSVTQSGDEVGSGTTLDPAVEPLTLESDRAPVIELRPLALDTSQTIKLDPLPATCVEQSYQHHFGLTFLGSSSGVLSLSAMLKSRPGKRICARGWLENSDRAAACRCARPGREQSGLARELYGDGLDNVVPSSP